jgi:hypothetical protein
MRHKRQVLYIQVRWDEVWCGLSNPRPILDQILQCITSARVQSRHCLFFISTTPAAHFTCCFQFLWSLSLYRERCCNFRTSQPQLVHPGSRYLANISMQRGLVGRYGAKTSVEEDNNYRVFPTKINQGKFTLWSRYALIGHFAFLYLLTYTLLSQVEDTLWDALTSCHASYSSCTIKPRNVMFMQ